MGTTAHGNTGARVGTGGFWHPERAQFFWFDSLHGDLHSVERGTHRLWQLDQRGVAAGWIDADRMLIAGASGLAELDLRSGRCRRLQDIESSTTGTNGVTGQTDPWGGFWIGSAGLGGQHGMGAIYRYYRGELRILVHRISQPVGPCFDAGDGAAFYVDSEAGTLMRVALDPDHGWPEHGAAPVMDLSDARGTVSGITTDAEGGLWLARTGSGTVQRYDARGNALEKQDFPVRSVGSITFGGAGLSTLFVTAGSDDDTAIAGEALAIRQRVSGCPAPRVIL